MIEYAVKTPTIPIPFHKLLKVVALVDGENSQTRALLELISAEKFEIEISDRYDRDVSEDAEVGAYIVSVDGERREAARKLAQAVRGIGFRTPLWAPADSSRIADTSVLGVSGDVDGYIYLGQQAPTSMLDYFLTFQESFNRFPGFNYEVQGVFQEVVDGRIKFHTYVVRE
jgi:hypothetical protein